MLPQSIGRQGRVAEDCCAAELTPLPALATSGRPQRPAGNDAEQTTASRPIANVFLSSCHRIPSKRTTCRQPLDQPAATHDKRSRSPTAAHSSDAHEVDRRPSTGNLASRTHLLSWLKPNFSWLHSSARCAADSFYSRIRVSARTGGFLLGCKMSANLLTIQEAATTLRVSYGTIRNAILAGRLKAYRFGSRAGTYRIEATDLDAFVATCQASSLPAPAKSQPIRGSAFKRLDGGRLLDAWRKQGVAAAPPDGRSVPSSASSCAPSTPTTS